MNSLVVLLSVVALAAGKPSQLLDGALLTYSSPIIAAAPAAVSHQSRLDIKSTPAVVATAVEPLARTIIAEPTLLASPVAIAAPSAVSHQSRLDIKSTPAITSTVVAAAPFAYSASIGAIAPAFVKTAAIAPVISTAGLIKTAEFVPGVIGAPAVPLDTPEVLAARAAHFEAKALTEAHLIHKRSVPHLYSAGISAPLVSTYSTAPLVSTYGVSPLTYSAISTPIYAKSYGLHAW